MLSVVFTLLVTIVSQSQSSEIVLQSSTSEVKRGLTDTLDLHCALNDTAASSNLIGRRSVNRCDVTKTVENVAEVSSIVITLNGKDVASVSHSSQAHVLDGSTNARVLGSVSGTTGMMELSYQTPTDLQTGEFLCEVNAISQAGHVVTFSTSVEVNLVEPSTADLIQAIKDLQAWKATMTDVGTELATLKNRMNTAVFFSAGVSGHLRLHKQQTVVYDRVFSNLGNGYDSHSGIFNCPTSGSYLFTVNALADNTYGFGLTFDKNGVAMPVNVYGSSVVTHPGHSVSVILPLVKGDQIKIVSWLISQLDPNYNLFTGHLIYFQ